MRRHGALRGFHHHRWCFASVRGMSDISVDSSSDKIPRTMWSRRPVRRGWAHILNSLFAIFGVAMIVIGYNSWAEVQPIAGGKTIAGTVVSVEDGQSCGRYGCSPNWTPTIRFQPPGATSYQFVGPTSDSQLSVGDTVTVSYLPSNPSIAHDISQSGGGGILGMVFGAVFFLVGLLSFGSGLSWLHRRMGITSARDGTGWVGHPRIHANGSAVGAGVFFVLAVTLVILIFR